MTPVRYSELLWDKTCRRGVIYEEALLEEVFVEGLHESVRSSMRIYLRSHKDAMPQSLAPYARSLVKLQ